MKLTIFSLVLLAAARPPAFAVQILVPEEHASIQEALAQAAGGDLVLVGPGEYLIEEPIAMSLTRKDPGLLR